MNSPLHWAIFKGHSNIVSRLILGNFSYEVLLCAMGPLLRLSWVFRYPTRMGTHPYIWLALPVSVEVYTAKNHALS